MKKKFLVQAIASLAIGTGVSIGAMPVASAMMLAPLSASDDVVSRAVVHVSGSVCTGTLISPQWVITAGHCIGENKVELGDRVDIGPDRGDFETKTITDIQKHPTYDVALLKLDSPAQTIPSKVYTGQEVPVGTATTIYGWGDLLGNFDDKVGYQTGKIVETQYYGVPDYPDMLGVNNLIDGESKVVKGDSGGPLFLADGQFYGVLSGGLLDESTLNGQMLTVYSQTPKILDWMKQTTGVNFSDQTNSSIDEQIRQNPPQFAEPSDDMFANTPQEEMDALMYFIETGNLPPRGNNTSPELPDIISEDSEETSPTNTPGKPNNDPDSPVSNQDPITTPGASMELIDEQKKQLIEAGVASEDIDAISPEQAQQILSQSQVQTQQEVDRQVELPRPELRSPSTPSAQAQGETVSDQRAEYGPKVDTGGEVDKGVITKIVSFVRSLI